MCKKCDPCPECRNPDLWHNNRVKLHDRVAEIKGMFIAAYCPKCKWVAVSDKVRVITEAGVANPKAVKIIN